LRLTLKAIKDVAGRRTAEAQAALVVDQKQAFMKITLDLEGTLLVDVETGVAVGMELDGPVTISGETEQADEKGNPVKVTVEGTGSCKHKSTASRLASETGSAPPPAPAAKPAAQAEAATKVDATFKVPAGWTSKEIAGGTLLEKSENTFYDNYTWRLL